VIRPGQGVREPGEQTGESGEPDGVIHGTASLHERREPQPPTTSSG
jgi:hypothetical protein